MSKEAMQLSIRGYLNGMSFVKDGNGVYLRVAVTPSSWNKDKGRSQRGERLYYSVFVPAAATGAMEYLRSLVGVKLHPKEDGKTVGNGKPANYESGDGKAALVLIRDPEGMEYTCETSASNGKTYVNHKLYAAASVQIGDAPFFQKGFGKGDAGRGRLQRGVADEPEAGGGLDRLGF